MPPVLAWLVRASGFRLSAPKGSDALRYTSGPDGVEPRHPREGAYTFIRGQWRVGRGHIPGSGANGV
eukprot:1196294-Prorocentrum_minimum.AAC.9